MVPSNRALKAQVSGQRAACSDTSARLRVNTVRVRDLSARQNVTLTQELRAALTELVPATLVGFHPDGSLTPSRFESYEAFQRWEQAQR